MAVAAVLVAVAECLARQSLGLRRRTSPHRSHPRQRRPANNWSNTPSSRNSSTAATSSRTARNGWTAEVQNNQAAKHTRLQFNSPDYFEFVAKNQQALPWLALGQNVQFVLDGVVYEIYE